MIFLLVWQYRTCPVLIPDVSGICPAAANLLFSGWFVGSPGMGREFRRLALQLTWRVHCAGHTGRVRYSYRTCPVWMTRGQRLVFKSREGREFRRESRVPTVRSSDMHREFQHLTNLNLVTCFSNMLRVGSSDVSQEFRRSGVPAFIGSSDASQLHCNLVTVAVL